MIELFVTPRRLMLLIACAAAIHSALMADESIHYSKKELRQLIQQAKTAEDYQQLATYFIGRENEYLAKAQTAQRDYEQTRHRFSLPKYPAAADTAKWFYQYDVGQAEQMAKLAAQYGQKQKTLAATPGTTTNSQPSR